MCGSIVNPRKLEHEFRMIRAGNPYTLLYGHWDNDVPAFWLLLYSGFCFLDLVIIGPGFWDCGFMGLKSGL